MGLAQFPDEQEYGILSGEAGASWLGGMTMPVDTELAALKIRLFKVGTPAGSERIRLGLYSRSDLKGAIALSEWVDLSDLADPLPANYMALVPFLFDRIPLRSGSTYHVGAITENYTRSAFTFYLAIALENAYQPVNTVVSGSPAEMHPFGYKERPRR